MRYALILFTAFCAAAASAQTSPTAAPVYWGEFNPVVGAWAQYGYTQDHLGQPIAQGIFKIAVVAAEGDDFWLEQTYTQTLPTPPEGASAVYCKLLVGPTSPRPLKLFVGTGAGLSDATPLAGQFTEAVSSAAAPRELEDDGTTQISVPAGVFTADKLVSADESEAVYIQQGIGPFGVISQVSGAGGETGALSLASYGSDAQPELPDAPTTSGGLNGTLRDLEGKSPDTSTDDGSSGLSNGDSADPDQILQQLKGK